MDTHSPFASTTTSHNTSRNNSTYNLNNLPTTTTTSSSSTTNVGFTSEMRDKQARGKDPYAERSDEESDFEGGERLALGGAGSGFAGRNGGVGAGGRGMGRGMTGRGGAGGLSWGERNNVRRKVEISGNAKAISSMSSNSNRHVDYDTLEKRRKASLFLNDPELLITHAEASGMTIAGSRHHFMLMLCGYDNAPRKKATQGSSSVSSGSSSRLYQAHHQAGSGYNPRV
ncbi:hypothetical protein QBC32DRAFT_34753 [Pseudoneurospora amorphoporcata]|uniref:Uncharacterized protein n=1 Tax=Pseudoneurospora amorphoporcata TaxID=241081 RepID=A0AAN6P4M5_9PEZI|nr:hypothetical protein QBC32DRAFT_34753 [Pseudoneurospora amorphoporcata]